MKQKNVDGLDISEDISFEKKEWTTERIGWTVMIIFVLAALAGLTGPGPLSKALYSGRYISIEYNRFERRQSPTRLVFLPGKQAVTPGTMKLTINREFIESIEIKGIQPEPEHTVLMGDEYQYEFNTGSGEESTKITFLYEADETGKLPLVITLPGKERAQFSQFIFP